MVSYLSFLGEEIRSRRRALKLSHSEACLVLCDYATQHSMKKFTYLKEEFMKKHNAVPRRQMVLFYIYIYKHPSRYTWCNLECVWLFPHLPTNPNILSLTEVIITGDSAECTIPGGWGATGAPNDGWHQYIHLLTHAYGSVRMQTHHSFALRKQLSELDMSVQSAPSTKNLDSTHYI